MQGECEHFYIRNQGRDIVFVFIAKIKASILCLILSKKPWQTFCIRFYTKNQGKEAVFDVISKTKTTLLRRLLQHIGWAVPGSCCKSLVHDYV